MGDNVAEKVGKYEIATEATVDDRLSVFLWGPSGAGKTTLAHTAPGPFLWVNTDPDGEKTLAEFVVGTLRGKETDVLLLDLSKQPPSYTQDFASDDGRGIEEFLKKFPKIQTVVGDSCTTFGEDALYHGVTVAQRTAKGRGSTIEDPGRSGYGNKNTWMRRYVGNLVRATKKMNKHLVVIGHEDKPTQNNEGVIMFVAPMLGGSLVTQIPIPFSEVWYLSGSDKERRIAIRPVRLHKPMKTRMFRTDGNPEFAWKYNSLTRQGEGIKDWWMKWKKNGKRKIALPA